MSIPTNHHYVSQVLSKKFKDNDGNLYLCDKVTGAIRKVSSTKNLFSEERLNSKLGKDGEIDHGSVEDTLNKNFENGFNTHYERIVAAISDNDKAGELAENGQLAEALDYLLGMGLIGEMRTPEGMIETQEKIFGAFRTLSELATTTLKMALMEAEYKQIGVKNKLPIEYDKLVERMKKSMGPVHFGIMVAPKDNYFLLPDCTSYTGRAQIEDDTILDGMVLSNPAKPIARVLMPLNSCILFLVESVKITRLKKSGIYKNLKSKHVFAFNKTLYNAAKKQVVCENEVYLRKFIEAHDK